MRAMVLERPRTPLVMRGRPEGVPAAGEILIEVAACGVCRTDLHVVDGELPNPKLPIVPGHEIVGRVAAIGAGAAELALGERVGGPWLGSTCGVCSYCRSGRENLCDRALFTGYTRDGGYATHAPAAARYCFSLPQRQDDAEVAPLLCAGLIGWRSYRMATAAEELTGAARLEALGLYGFGAAAHILVQVAVWQGRRVYAFTRVGDEAAQGFAKTPGAGLAWGSDEVPGRDASRAARCRDYLRARRPARPPGAEGGKERRARGLRGHPHVGHSELSLSAALGGAAHRLGRQPHTGGCARIFGAGAAGRREE